ncbi:MAG TPA: hypothetical protein IAB38_00385, partial [Candidatus Onthousia excrementipullorum]|nr:hypothetical protein [Candidatus Onthousia excrementipullorum]
MNNNYNLLMARRINMIEQNPNEEYIRKFNLSLDTIKRKKKRKLKPKELDELKYLIKDLQNIPKDENFQDYILRHLKVFLIYGNVKLIDRNDIVLELTTDKETSILYIEINKDYVTSTLKGKDYREETYYKKLDNDYYTTFKRRETNIYKNRNTSLHEININDEFHGFRNNKEIITRIISSHDNYTKDNITGAISRKGYGEDNYKEVTNYYRKDGYIVKKHQRRYKKKNIGELLNYKEYQISEDYNINDKYLNPVGCYKKFN